MLQSTHTHISLDHYTKLNYASSLPDVIEKEEHAHMQVTSEFVTRVFTVTQ